jgi:hypothetical protein
MTLKILLWFTRILAILSILILIPFTLDAFGGNEPVIRQILSFLKHNIPVFILIIALIIAWKYEIAGGMIFILLFIALGIYWDSFIGNSGSLILIIPYLLVGILFILHRILILKSKV